VNVAREQIYTALFALLQNAANFKTVGRVWVPSNKLDPPQLPALFLVENNEHARQTAPGRPAKWLLDVDVVIYTRNEGESQVPGAESYVPAMALNNLLDAVESALAPPSSTNVQTLGALVQHCWIEGEIEKDAVLQGANSMAVVPVRILTTG
jgi:hypothetical protein